MAVIRLANGTDVSVKMTVAEAIAAVKIESGTDSFVELPGDGGPIHVRPSGVIAVLEDAPRGTAGFRIGQSA
jgi:hypothetical protein